MSKVYLPRERLARISHWKQGRNGQFSVQAPQCQGTCTLPRWQSLDPRQMPGQLAPVPRWSLGLCLNRRAGSCRAVYNEFFLHIWLMAALGSQCLVHTDLTVPSSLLAP